MKHSRLGVFVAVVLALVAGAGSYFYVLHCDKRWGVYGMVGKFVEMPTDDTALLNWIGLQNGVSPATVRVIREGKKIRVWFTSNVKRTPVLPDLEEVCARFGYKGQQGTFDDDSNDLTENPINNFKFKARQQAACNIFHSES